MGGLCPCPRGSHVPAGVQQAASPHHPPTKLVPTSSFALRKPQSGAETPATKPEKGRRDLDTPSPPVGTPHSHWENQHLKQAQSHPTCRMSSIPCPEKLLFSPREMQSPLREGHGGVCKQLPTTSRQQFPHRSHERQQGSASSPVRQQHSYLQTPLFPSSFTTGTENTKHEKIGFFVPPTPHPQSVPAIYRQRRAAQWQQLHLLLAGSLHTQPLAQLLQLAGQQEQQPGGGDTRVRGGGKGWGGCPMGQGDPVGSRTPTPQNGQGSDANGAVVTGFHGGPTG